MMSNPANPIIVQSDRSVLLEVDCPLYEEARDGLAQFAELVKSPEHIHTYRITPLSLWNAAAAGMPASEMIAVLQRYGKYDLPETVRQEILESVGRYGLLKLTQGDDSLLLTAADDLLLDEILSYDGPRPFLGSRLDRHTVRVHPMHRGLLKQALIKLGYPVEDLAGYVTGDPLALRLGERTRSGEPFALRRYQHQAVDAFYAGGSARGGSGVVVLPCGAGKTLVGLGAMEKVGAHTLIVATNTVAVRQWIHEILERTNLRPDEVGEYTGDQKEIRPVTVTTYQALTYRRRKDAEFEHLRLFHERNWGLIIYDEVHLLPAPVFRVTAEIQARRRLGLTATLVREDGREDDVFSLIGPKKHDVPWRELERQGWIAQALCYELRVPLPEERRRAYALAPMKDKYRIAAENPLKIRLAEQLVERHRHDQVLIIGQYLEQLEEIRQHFGAPLITGKTPNREREQLYERFRTGELKLLIVSKVANFSIDLPDANVAIQVSGTFGSRQEEAQRLGRILRPKTNTAPARFYTLVTHNTRDQEFANNRQLFLTEQGYQYNIHEGLPPAEDAAPARRPALAGV
ncbi:MAG: DEAD/DEAH box helicase [Armatimonadetes bacterium]|jgi:DNA excision repair protein ERCC-3|nr:DEAD/DEAH box helicase [Armatimonadota bacterium]